MANNNGHHSFYKEQQKSILGQEKWTAKRIGKLLLTLLKWFLWGFLIIATLWGCVNEFIIQTSKNLGQGVEFYQADDFIYPNTYQAVNITGYTSSKVAVEEGKIDKSTEDLTFVNEKEKNYSQTNPFNFWIANPYLAKDEADIPDWASNEDLFVNAIEFAEQGGEVSSIYYNLNVLTYTALLGAVAHDASDLEIDDAWMLQFSLSTDFKNYLNADDMGLPYDISNTTDFYYYIVDTKDGKTDNKVDIASADLAEDINWGETDSTDFYTIDDAISLNGILIANTSDLTTDNFNDVANWKVSRNLNTSYTDESTAEEVEVAITNKIKQDVNMMAFNNGTGIANSADYLATVTSNGSTIGDLYLEEYKSHPNADSSLTTIDPSYSVDYNNSFLSDLSGVVFDSGVATPEVNIYGGAQTIVVPIEKGFPVRINEESQKLVESWRGYDFQKWDTSESEQQDKGFDIENQMYGWTVLDSTTSNESNGYQASVMRVYDSAADAVEGKALTAEDEEDAFYADQRRLGWGLISAEEAEKESYQRNSIRNDSGEFTNLNGDGQKYTVFDEKIKSWMSEDKYVRMESTIEINGEEVTYAYATEFAGMESVNQAAYGFNNENPAYFYGTTPEIEHNASYKGQELNQETSILSDSIIPTMQDAWGESRVTFIGWADWGKAWDVQYGPLYGAFVFPLAQLAMMIGTWFSYMASAWGVIISIAVIVFLTRGLGALLSFKGTSNQMKMQEVQTDVAKIKAKYAKYDLKAEPRIKQKQQMEIMALYRKKEINPMGSLGTIFITMPIFISLWIIISALPAYKVVFMGNFSWAVSSFYGIFNMGWLFILYLLIGISVGLVQGISSKLPTWLSNKRKGIKRIDEATKQAAKKQNKTQNIMIGVFVFMGLTVPALFAFYWICSGFFTIILELVKHAWKVHVAEEMKKDPTYETPFARVFKRN